MFRMELIKKTSGKWNKFGRKISVLALFVIMCLLFNGCVGQKAYKVGILAGLDYIITNSEGFKSKMTELGYIEGKNIVYDFQKINFDMEGYKKALKKFVDDKVDLIYVYPTEAVMEAKKAVEGTKIPVIFSFANIEDTDLVKSVREPGGNLTGVRYPGPDITIRRFEIMRELLPQAKRLWLPYQKGCPISQQLEVLYPAAKEAGVTLIEFPAANAAELEAGLQARAKSKDLGFDAIMFLAEPLAVTPDAFAVMSKFAAERKIPIGGALMVDGDYGSFFGVNIDPYATGQQAANLADKVLKGAEVGMIPVISSENFLQINYKVSQKLGINVSESLLSQANEIIR